MFEFTGLETNEGIQKAEQTFSTLLKDLDGNIKYTEVLSQEDYNSLVEASGDTLYFINNIYEAELSLKNIIDIVITTKKSTNGLNVVPDTIWILRKKSEVENIIELWSEKVNNVINTNSIKFNKIKEYNGFINGRMTLDGNFEFLNNSDRPVFVSNDEPFLVLLDEANTLWSFPSLNTKFKNNEVIIEDEEEILGDYQDVKYKEPIRYAEKIVDTSEIGQKIITFSVEKGYGSKLSKSNDQGIVLAYVIHTEGSPYYLKYAQYSYASEYSDNKVWGIGSDEQYLYKNDKAIYSVNIRRLADYRLCIAFNYVDDNDKHKAACILSESGFAGVGAHPEYFYFYSNVGTTPILYGAVRNDKVDEEHPAIIEPEQLKLIFIPNSEKIKDKLELSISNKGHWYVSNHSIEHNTTEIAVFLGSEISTNAEDDSINYKLLQIQILNEHDPSKLKALVNETEEAAEARKNSLEAIEKKRLENEAIINEAVNYTIEINGVSYKYSDFYNENGTQSKEQLERFNEVQKYGSQEVQNALTILDEKRAAAFNATQSNINLELQKSQIGNYDTENSVSILEDLGIQIINDYPYDPYVEYCTKNDPELDNQYEKYEIDLNGAPSYLIRGGRYTKAAVKKIKAVGGKIIIELKGNGLPLTPFTIKTDRLISSGINVRYSAEQFNNYDSNNRLLSGWFALDNETSEVTIGSVNTKDLLYGQDDIFELEGFVYKKDVSSNIFFNIYNINFEKTNASATMAASFLYDSLIENDMISIVDTVSYFTGEADIQGFNYNAGFEYIGLEVGYIDV